MSEKKVSKKLIQNIEETIDSPKKEKKEERFSFSTGSDLLDLIVGGGERLGYPSGKIINIVGDKSSGKTFFALELLASNYHKFKKKLKWEYDDCESGFSFDTKFLYGFEIMPENIEDRKRSETVEDAYCNIRNFFEKLKPDEKGIYILDSLDGLTSEEADELAEERYKAFQKGKEFNKGSYKMGKAKYLSQEFFPQLADFIEKKEGLLIIISQVRQNVDPMSFEKFTRAGGKAMDFYCHTVLWLANIHKIRNLGRVTGVTIKAKTTKSKTRRPYREGFMHLVFDYGLDNIMSNVDFLYDNLTDTGLIQKDCKIRWGEGIKELNLSGLKEFLQEQNKEEYYRENISKKLNKTEVIEWIESQEDLKKVFQDTFGITMTRKEFAEFIEKNHLQEEITNRVREKWEGIESSIRSIREPKYK